METEKLADTFMVVMSQFLFLKASWIKRVYHLNGAGVIHKNQREKMWSTKNSRQIGCMTISIYQYYQVLVNISRTPSSPCVVRCFETPRVGLGTCGPLRNILRRRCELLFGSRNFHLVDPTKYIHVYTSISKVGSTLAYLFFDPKYMLGSPSWDGRGLKKIQHANGKSRCGIWPWPSHIFFPTTFLFSGLLAIFEPHHNVNLVPEIGEIGESASSMSLGRWRSSE